MKRNKGLKITLIVIVLLSIVYFFLPEYAQTALIYQKVGIDDYPIFDNRAIEANKPVEWRKHEQYNETDIPKEYMQYLEEMETVAFVIIKDGKLYHEEYFDGYSDSSLTNSFSMAKSIVSLLVGVAIQDNYIQSLDDPVAKYVPRFDTKTNRELTIRDVITMSSGLNWDESYGSLFSTTTEAYYGTDLKSLITSLEMVEEPGKEYKYLSGNTQLLAMVVKNATGKTLSEYASEKLWTPLNAEEDALWSLDTKDGYEKAYCCFNSNATDFARIGQMVLDSGRWQGQQIINESYILNSIQPANYLVDAKTNDPVDFYGYQWWILDYKDTTIPYARGILGQYIMVVPEKGMVIVRLGHKRSEVRLGKTQRMCNKVRGPGVSVSS